MEYILLLVWIGAMALIAKGVKLKKAVMVSGVEVERYYWLFAFVAFLPIILVAGNRPDFIGDTYNYKFSYINAPEHFSDFGKYYETSTKDKGYYFFAAIIKTIFHVDYRIYFMILAFIQGITIICVFRKYSEEYILSVFLFIAASDFTWMMNGIRQFTAVTIILAATALIIRKKYLGFILVVLFASLFHQSALIMIPIFFLIQGEAWNKKTLIYIAVVLIAVVFIGQFTSLLDSALQETQYKNTSMFLFGGEGDDGVHPLRVLVYSVPAIISFFGRRTIKESSDSLINICANMSVITAGLYVIAMFTSGITLGRLPIYTSLFSYILLPWEINHILQEKNRIVVIIITIIAYLFYFYYQMHIAWSLF